MRVKMSSTIDAPELLRSQLIKATHGVVICQARVVSQWEGLDEKIDHVLTIII